MANEILSLGYEQLYSDRLEETKSMITLATLLDVLDQGVGEDLTYRSIMAKAYEEAESANPKGIPTRTPEVSLVSSVVRSNVKIMIYNIIEFSVTSLVQAIYDRIEGEQCGYAEVSEKLRAIWHRTRMRSRLNDPTANNNTAERVSKELLDHAVANTTLHFETRHSIAGGNLDGDKILQLFNDHGVVVHAAEGNYRANELKDIKDRRNGLAHGSVSFEEAGSQIITSELAELLSHVDSFLTQLRKDVIAYLDAGRYRLAGEGPSMG